jgi:type I restriction enzyme, S subunit
MTGFHQISLGDVLTLQRGFDITKSEQSNGEIPIVSSSGISSYHNKWKVKGPGVIIGRKGTLGTVHFLRSNYWPHDTTLWIKDFKGNDPRFLNYFLQTLKLENFDVGASNPTLNRNHLHKIKIIFPKEGDTQKRIAAILSAYDELIENNQRRIALLKKMSEEVYREWFIRFRFPGHEKVKFVKGLPEQWKVQKLGQLFSTSSGGTPSRENSSHFAGDICWAKTGELKSTFVLDTEEKITQQGLDSSAAKIYPRYTILIAMYCAMPDISILSVDSATNQACCAFFPKNGYFHYAYSYLLIKFAQKHMINFAHGAAQQNLSQGLIKGFPLLTPTKDLIVDFSKVAAPIFIQVEQLMKANACLQKTLDQLLQRLISGKLSVENLDIQIPPGMTEELKTEPAAHA